MFIDNKYDNKYDNRLDNVFVLSHVNRLSYQVQKLLYIC